MGGRTCVVSSFYFCFIRNRVGNCRCYGASIAAAVAGVLVCRVEKHGRPPDRPRQHATVPEAKKGLLLIHTHKRVEGGSKSWLATYSIALLVEHSDAGATTTTAVRRGAHNNNRMHAIDSLVTHKPSSTFILPPPVLFVFRYANNTVVPDYKTRAPLSLQSITGLVINTILHLSVARGGGHGCPPSTVHSTTEITKSAKKKTRKKSF